VKSVWFDATCLPMWITQHETTVYVLRRTTDTILATLPAAKRIAVGIALYRRCVAYGAPENIFTSSIVHQPMVPPVPGAAAVSAVGQNRPVGVG